MAASSTCDDPEWRALNRANWEERTAIHLGPRGYDLAPHRAGRGRLDAIAAAEVGDVTGLRILHLQCHVGQDSIALVQAGAAHVTGVDFSPAAIAAAQALAAECGVAERTRFVESDVLETQAALPGEAASHDLVFTTWGTIAWLPDLRRWAQAIAWALRPSGALYFADTHPTALIFDDQVAPDAQGRPGWLVPYFERAPREFVEPDYADPSASFVQKRTIAWLHPTADILAALSAAGLRLDWLREHPRMASRQFACLVEDAEGMWTWPNAPWLPLGLSLRATRP